MNAYHLVHDDDDAHSMLNAINRRRRLEVAHWSRGGPEGQWSMKYVRRLYDAPIIPKRTFILEV